MGDDADGQSDHQPSSKESSPSWKCVWKTRPANPVSTLSFSPDGTLFATCGKNDRLVRVWYQNNATREYNRSISSYRVQTWLVHIEYQQACKRLWMKQ